MPIYALGDQVPDIHPDAFVHPDAVIIGSVTIGAESSIWPGAVLRGDDGYITIGARTSIQDNSVLHTTPMWPTVVGDDCVVGHIVHLEGCTIESGVLVGNGSIVLHRVIVRTGAIVSVALPVAFALIMVQVVMGTITRSAPALNLFAVGIPATVKPDRARAADIEMGVASYLHKSRRYRDTLRRID